MQKKITRYLLLDYPKITFLLSILVNIILAVLVFASIDNIQITNYFNADTLYLPSIYKDIFIDKGTFYGWHLNAAPNFLPDMLLFFIIRSFFSHFIPACFAYSLIQLTLIFILFSVLYKSINKSINYYHLSFGILCMSVFLLVTFFDNDFIYTFYYLSISYHLGAFINCLLALIFLFRYINLGKRRTLILWFIIITFSIINDRLFLVMFSFPLYALVLLFFRRNSNSKRILIAILLNTISIPLGLFLFRMLRLSDYFYIITLSWKVFNFENIIPSLKVFIEQHSTYIRELKFRGIIDLLFILSFFLHLAILIKKLKDYYNHKKVEYNELIYLLLFVPTVLSILFTPILNGSYVGWGLLRYNTHSLYFGIFSLSYVLYKIQQKFNLSDLWIKAVVSLYILILIGYSFRVIYNNNIPQKLDAFFKYYPERIKNIDDISEENHLKYGISDYWDAKYITMFSKKDLRVYTVYDNLTAWYHVMNENWYYNSKKGKYKNPVFTFVIADRLNAEIIKTTLGQPLDTLNCSNMTVLKFKPFEFDRNTRKPKIIEHE